MFEHFLVFLIVLLTIIIILFSSTKSEIQKSDLELELNRGKTEEAGLRDALHKMQQLNEGLGQDKIELNKY
jgi:hypothetical protein